MWTYDLKHLLPSQHQKMKKQKWAFVKAEILMKRAFNVSQNAFDSSKIGISRRMHMLANFIGRKESSGLVVVKYWREPTRQR